MKNKKDFKDSIDKLKSDLDGAYREMADGVRDLLCLREAYTRLNKENKVLRSLTTQTLSRHHGITLNMAKAMTNDMVSEEMNK